MRWMLFVDGENFAIRGRMVLERRGLALPGHGVTSPTYSFGYQTHRLDPSRGRSKITSDVCDRDGTFDLAADVFPLAASRIDHPAASVFLGYQCLLVTEPGTAPNVPGSVAVTPPPSRVDLPWRVSVQRKAVASLR